MCNYCGCRDFPLVAQLTDIYGALSTIDRSTSDWQALLVLHPGRKTD